MKKDEVEKVIGIILEVDGGCKYCVSHLLGSLIANFLLPTLWKPKASLPRLRLGRITEHPASVLRTFAQIPL